jgi:hypothetical protein
MLISLAKVVLPDRIELSTSPLPMECSTTELRQHAPIRESAEKGPDKARRSLPQGPHRRKREPAGMPSKALQSAWSACGLLQEAQLRADPVPHFPLFGQRLDRPDHHLEFDHFGGRNASVGFSSIRFSSMGLVSD